MLTEEFDYDLPEELVAQEPIEPRDASRLLIVRRDEGTLEHRRFRDIVDYLEPGDVLVANETRVIPARLEARKVPTGGKVELLLLAKRGDRHWEALVTGRRVDIGQRLRLVGDTDQELLGTVKSITKAGGRLIAFDQPIEPHLQQIGITPLPPYIHRTLSDPERYQTVYAAVEGSVAAPTAGLHFTPELMERTKRQGIRWVRVLLHIGLDTFRPITEEHIEEHAIHTEYCHLTRDAAQEINAAKRRGNRVIAIGTTSVRVLETAAGETDQSERVSAWEGSTDLFIYPGYRFRAVDALITNFHLPRSSLLLLVSAFASYELIRRAYEEAIAERYRFYSLGDSMLIL